VNGHADISLCVGDQVLRNLTVDGSRARPLSRGLTASGLSASFLQSTFRVSYLGSTPEIPLTRTVAIESILNQTDASGLRGPVDLGTIIIPLIGNASSYPLDSYSAAGLWVVSVPSNMEVITSDSGQVGWTAPIDVAATPNAGDIDWSWGYINTLGDVIEANRIPSIKYFVLLIAGLPLLLFTGLLALVRPIINNPDRHGFPAELLVGVGAFLLAILPIRAILVPADISQVTVTDYILGTEMALMVASSVMIVLAGTMKPRKKALVPRKERDSPNDPDGTDHGEVPEHSRPTATDTTDRIASDAMRHRRRIIGVFILGATGIAALAEIRERFKQARRGT
jgi:hypothetical protein